MARILIVDDEESIRKALVKYLTGLGYDVVAAADGAAALALVDQQPVDLAIVDLVMPKMDGVECIRRLKAKNSDIVAIVLTGFGTITTAVEAIKA
ncbi:MAG: response regulator, partial [Deltaproteobacteria bacterium]|nr:response regulator [Deltaproteobacteria bacterium]